jgi:hypothetical protein
MVGVLDTSLQRHLRSIAMATYFEIKELTNGYRWDEMFHHQLGLRYAVEVLRIPSTDIEAVICEPDVQTLGVLLKEDAHLGHDDWFMRLMQAHPYIRTEADRITFF